MSQDAEHRFSFEAPSLSPAGNVSDRVIASLDASAIERSLRYARQVSYHWDIASDRITWSNYGRDVLAFDTEQVSTGRLFATILDRENFFSRYDTVLRSNQSDAGDGVAYEIEYRLKVDADSGLNGAWIEDTGRWFADANGVPCEAVGIMRVADERHMRDQQMSFLSNCDPLTGMMNRARLTQALGEAIEVANTDKVPCAFAILAVNNLDVMNEAYGYEVADEVIVALGQRLRQVMRMGDGIARYSGSKFAIILNSCKPDELNAALERFMRAVRDSVIETRLGPVWALLSIGAVSLPALGDNATTAVAHAEEALSVAFRLPSDGYVVFTSSDERRARRMLNARCATEIVSCLRDGLFKLAFQPVFDAKTGEVLFHEALLRMADTTGALITAGHLVPIAERLGLIRLIDRAVLQLALKTLQNFPSARVSVNISATTVTDPRWNVQLLEMIAASPQAASRLIVEITETAALGNLQTSKDFSSALRELGCGVALDDFGAGYTSYRNLKELSLTHIKLDGSFCCQLNEGGENRTFVQSMVDLAQAFDLKVIAEWVDTPEDAEVLTQMGVDGLQGNMLGEASIEAPWTGEAESNFSMSAPSLEPVDAVHFQHVVPAIEDPKQAAGYSPGRREDHSAPVDIHSISLSNIALIEDDALDAEIARLEAGEQTDKASEAVYPGMLEPLYETAMSISVEMPVAVIAAELPEHHTDEDQLPDVDDSLAKLRAAISELAAAWGTSEPAEEARLAS